MTSLRWLRAYEGILRAGRGGNVLVDALDRASPRPWRTKPDDPVTGYADIDNRIVAADGRTVADIYGGRELQPQRTGLPTFSECRANAELIVHAVNSAHTPSTAADELAAFIDKQFRLACEGLAGEARLREAATQLSNFAWSAIKADNVEAEEYLNELILNLRTALAATSPEDEGKPAGEQ